MMNISKDTKFSSSTVPGTNPSPPAEHQGEHTKESASKRRKNQLSCAECRRLKLRCDRVFPCESCRKRGCAAICPEGALTTKGTRFVLANTEGYHAKISDLSERIRRLENALAAVNTVSPHPLLREDLLLVKVPVELSNKAETPPQRPQPSDAEPRDSDTVPILLNYGTLKLGSDGRSRFFGQTAQAEHFLKDDDDSPEEELLGSSHPLPLQLQHVSHAFPNGSKSRDVPLVKSILESLPSIPEANELVDIYYAHSAWMYMPCPRLVFMESFTHVLEHIEDPEGISLHRLALVFATMAHGALTDLRQEPYSAYSVQLHQLARASLSVTPFIREPSLAAVQTLVGLLLRTPNNPILRDGYSQFLLGFFWALFNKKEAANAGWLIQCLNCKLAQTLGLHRDLEYWDAEDKISQGEARRQVFWELLTLEGWMSLGLGRPSTMDLSEIHCKMPCDTERAMNAPDARLHVWHTWKHGLTPYVSRVLQKALNVKTPPYLEILELDRSIQAYKMPPDVAMLVNGMTLTPPPPEESPGLTMQRSLLIQAHSTALLLLHRGFFAQALEEETDPMQSRFAPSVLATYTSAWRIILALQIVYSQHPALTCRFGLYWSNVFSASISMCLLVTRATRSSYATSALGGLNLVYDLFSSAAPDCAPAAKALPIVTRLREKAHAAYAPYRHGHPASSVTFDASSDNEDEELKTLGGKTNIARLLVPPSLLSSHRVSHVRSEQYTRSPSLPPSMPPTDHLESVHPLLLQYVEQSRWVSDTYSERPLEHTDVPPSGSSDLYVEPGFTDPHTGIYMQPPQQQQQIHHSHQQLQQQQEVAYNYTDYSTQPSYAMPTHSTHNTANANISLSSSLPVPLSANQDYTPQPHFYADPSLDSYAAQPELQERNQYAAWQAHMEQLGLPY